MNIVLIAALLVSTFGLIFAEESNYCDNAENFIYERVSSNISFSVLLKLHEGDDCAMENSRYVQKASEIVTIINLINISPLLDGIKIGAEIFDTCLLNECLKTDHQMIPDFVIQPNGTYFLGTLVPEELLGDKVPNSLPPSPRFTISRDHNIRLLVTSTVRTLRQLKIRKIDVLLSSSSAFLDDFRVKGTWAVICIKKKSHTTDYTSLCECNAKRRTILIALAAENLPEFANATSSCGCNDRFVLVITGSDVDMDTLQEYVYWMNDSYVIGPADLLIKFPEIKSEEEALSLKSNLSTLNYSLNFISTSTAVSRIYQSLKIKLRNECGRNDALSVCPELTEFDPLEALVSASPFFYDIEELAKEMQLDLENMVLYVSFKINDNEDINPVEIMTKDMIYNQHPLELIQSMPTIIQKEAVCHDHVTCNECPNFVFQPKSEEIFFWKDLPIRFKTEILRNYPIYVKQFFLKLVKLVGFYYSKLSRWIRGTYLLEF